MYPATLCSFWVNFSGYFARLTCKHSYGYAFRSIEQTDSLKSPQNSAFSCNMRARVAIVGQKPVIFTPLTAFKSLTSKNTIPWIR